MPTLKAPPADADPAILLDWLELCAFHDDRWRARLDEIDNAFKIQDETQASDPADEEQIREERHQLIEAELNLRQELIGDAYPFEMTGDGEEVQLVRNRGPSSYYLACLIFSHATRSEILRQIPARILARGRRIEFQILSTLAVAGHLEGPALSFGWPRALGQTIVQSVRRLCQLAHVGTERNPPGPLASKFAKDGGMDVIGWRPAINGAPPPSEICYGQAASGHGWREKSALQVLERFQEAYFLDRPQVNDAGVTVVPFRLTADDFLYNNKAHGNILDRMRTPRAAMRGFQLSQLGVTVDEANRAYYLAVWLARYRSQEKRAA